jgi:hypothetical protein
MVLIAGTARDEGREGKLAEGLKDHGKGRMK